MSDNLIQAILPLKQIKQQISQGQELHWSMCMLYALTQGWTLQKQLQWSHNCVRVQTTESEYVNFTWSSNILM